MKPLDLILNPQSKELLHRQISAQLTAQIRDGRLPPGQRLPNIRDLARSLAVSTNVIVDAYRELKRIRLLETRPGLGTFVSLEARYPLRRPDLGKPDPGVLEAATRVLGFEVDARGYARAFGLPEARERGEPEAREQGECLPVSRPTRRVPIRQIQWYGLRLRTAVQHGFRLGLDRTEIRRLFTAALIWENWRWSGMSLRSSPDTAPLEGVIPPLVLRKLNRQRKRGAQQVEGVD